MPSLIIATNLKKDQIPEKFCSEATAFLADELGKPPGYILIQVCPDQVMTFGDSGEPCANITLNCIGVVGPDKNRKMAPKLSDFIEKKLGIKKDRFYINIFDIERSSCVWNGSTFG
ncbi:macrophage migration inhibitory factor [Elysia marginata]|uniref:L-dopachrome isomerase n=1 Tax=Elysia marginata TaxID=1093978 RepID=A0AAV4JCL1_9GAST|nr:macrophage migration inhibitory factor [Elysia marginata]